MLKKANNGWYVASESGKRLSKVYPTKQEAQQRLKEIEYFKNKKTNKRGAKTPFFFWIWQNKVSLFQYSFVIT